MTIMPGAEPFYFKGDAVGCLMVHGFTGTPNEVRWLGEQLAGGGRTVLGVLLSGHGTTVEEMNRTRWPDWYASVLEGYWRLRAECAQVFVMGLSLGGMLALHLATQEQPDGIVPMAAPAHIRDWRITAFRPFQRWIPYWHKSLNEYEDPEAAATHLEYDRFPTACVISLVAFAEVVRKGLPRVLAPALLVHSKTDRLADAAEIGYISERLGTRDKHVLALERSGHIVCRDIERERVLSEVRQFVEKRRTDKKT